MEEFKILKRFSKDILKKEHHKKINSLCCLDDKKDAFKFLLISEIKMKYLNLNDLIEKYKNHEDYELLMLKSNLIPHKIIFLQENFQEKDFKKILALLDELELRLLDNGII